jgi:hypothetical protein
LGFVKITEWKKKEGFHCCSFVNVFKLKGFLYKLITGSRRLFKISIKYLGVRLIWRKKVFKPEKISSLRKKLVNDKYEILDFKFFTNNKNSLVKIKNNNFSENTKDYSFDRNKFMKNFPNQKAGVDSLLLDSYYSIIKMCKDENIKLILFSAPEDEEYVQAQLDKDKIKNIFKSSTDLYKNLVYLDYTPYGEFWEKKYEFWLKDSHHIFQDSLFTEEFTDDILLKTIEP